MNHPTKDKTNKKVEQPQITIGRDTSFISICIILLNFINALMRFNQADFSNIDILDIGFVILIILLFINSLDVIVSFVRYKRNKLVKISKGFAWASIIGSGGILLMIASVIFNFCEICDGKLSFAGNFSFFNSVLHIPCFPIKYCMCIYLFAASFQAFSAVCRHFAIKQIKQSNQ